MWKERASCGFDQVAAPEHMNPIDPRRSAGATCLFRCRLPALSSAHHHIGLPAAALRTNEPVAPIEHRCFGAVASSHLGRVGLDPMTAILAPYDQPDTGGCDGSGFLDSGIS
jgi:hypothetical protein